MKKSLLGTTSALVLMGGIALFGSSAAFAATGQTVAPISAKVNAGQNIQQQSGAQVDSGKPDRKSATSEQPEVAGKASAKKGAASAVDSGPNVQVQSGSQVNNGATSGGLDSSN